MMILVLVVTVFSLLALIRAQDPAVYGVYAQILDPGEEPQQRDISQINSNCFEGLGLIRCTPTLPDDETELSYELAYYKDLASISGSNYCLQCCGNSPTYIDTWDLTCPINLAEINTMNSMYGYELRMAQKKFVGDQSWISCPLPRSACSTNATTGKIFCDKQRDTTHLIAVTVTLTVKQYNSQFVYWNGVSKCNIEVTETNQSIEAGKYYNFRETIIMVHEPLGPLELANDPTKIIVIVLVIFFVVYMCLRFCRKKHCPYCQKKLLISLNLCIYCQLVGAEMPDPILLKALEEKTKHAQGTIPEQFPGATICVGFCRGLIKLICCVRKYEVTKVLPVVEGAVVAQVVADGMVTEFVDAERKEDLSSTQSPTKQHKHHHHHHHNKSILKNNTTANTKEKKKPGKEKPRNPNILDYPDDIIYRAVQHPYAINNNNDKVDKIV